jgi:lysophospholipase L1-like esterase
LLGHAPCNIAGPMRRGSLLPTLALALASACAADGGDGSGAGADAGIDPPAPAYLALGDSVAFGFDPLVDTRRTDQFAGYPEVLAARRAVPVANASCPGEASGGFISPTGADNHCRENKAAYPLHVAYDGTQLDFALAYLADHPGTELVTIDLGGNDVSRLNDVCGGEVGCLLEGFGPMLLDYSENLDTIFTAIREVYDGPLVALAIYNPKPDDATYQFGLERLNSALAARTHEHGGLLADGHAAFATATEGGDPCAAGLLIPMPDGTCDIHPSPLGDQVLADAIEAALE